jgi:hypothetical protein
MPSREELEKQDRDARARQAECARPKHYIPEPEWGDVNVAAVIINVSASFLNKARMTGGGPPYSKFARAVRYHLPTLRKWATSRMRTSTSDTTEAR